MGRYVVPAGDIPARDRPDGSIPPTGRVSAGIEVVEAERLGSWSRVLVPDGREVWVDARRLVAVSEGKLVASPIGDLSRSEGPGLPAGPPESSFPSGPEPVIPSPPSRLPVPLLLAAFAALVMVGVSAVVLLTGDDAAGEIQPATSTTLEASGSLDTTPGSASTTVPPKSPATSTTLPPTSTTLPPAPLGQATKVEAVYEAFGASASPIVNCNSGGNNSEPCWDDAGTGVLTGAQEGETVLLFKPVTAGPDWYWVLVSEQVDGSFLAVDVFLADGEFEWPNSPWLP